MSFITFKRKIYIKLLIFLTNSLINISHMKLVPYTFLYNLFVWLVHNLRIYSFVILSEWHKLYHFIIIKNIHVDDASYGRIFDQIMFVSADVIPRNVRNVRKRLGCPELSSKGDGCPMEKRDWRIGASCGLTFAVWEDAVIGITVRLGGDDKRALWRWHTMWNT